MKSSKLFIKSYDQPMGIKLNSKFLTKNNNQIQLILTDTHLYRISIKSKKSIPLTTALRFQIKIDAKWAVLRLEMDDGDPISYRFTDKPKLWEIMLKQYLPELDYQSNYDMGKLVGNGSFASVYSAIRKADGERVAMKAFLKRILIQKDPSWRLQIENEIQVMRKLNHQNLIKLYDVFENKAQLYLIMDLARGGSLEQALKKLETPLPFLSIKVIFRQILEGVKSMHDSGYMHRDLKPGNILFKNPMSLKSYGLAIYEPNILISDFGISSQIKKKLDVYQFCGSYGYMAPEIFECEEDPKKSYDEKCDIFSLGCILYRLITNKSLFSSTNHQQQKQMNKDCVIDWKSMTQQLYGSKPLTTLLQKMLSPDPNLRPSCEQLLQTNILTVQFDEEGCPVFQDYQKPRIKTLQTSRPRLQAPHRSSLQQMMQTQIVRKSKPKKQLLPPIKRVITEGY